MAVKKTQLYASLWASCDKLRGGMDSSEYKDYILTLLFMKYVTDKFKNKGAYEDIKVFDKAHDKDPDPEKRTGCSFDDFIALKGKKNIGEGMDKIIARLADENTDLKGVIDIAHFNDEKKLGRPQGFRITIRQVSLSAGAGFMVAITGAIMKMPGLPKVPAAEKIDVSSDGKITGLF